MRIFFSGPQLSQLGAVRATVAPAQAAQRERNRLRVTAPFEPLKTIFCFSILFLLAICGMSNESI